MKTKGGALHFPPVYRPQFSPLVQPKGIVRPAMPPPVYRPAAPRLVRPFGRFTGVVQPMRRSARIADPNYVHTLVNPIAPSTIDKHGTQYWNGFRPLSFDTPTKNAMAPYKAAGCQVQGWSCTGSSDGIDHIIDFATTQASLPTHIYCDGHHHWQGNLKTDAEADYNILGNLQWSCNPCNSSKSGARGLYSPPQWMGACPGATCPY